MTLETKLRQLRLFKAGTLECTTGLLVSIAVLIAFMSTNLLAESGQQYGDPLSETQVIDLVELMTNPSPYVDKNIKIAGNIKDVCPHKGCWIEVENPEAEVSLRVKVQDDVIVFPSESRGKSVVAEGILRKFELSEARTRAWLKHKAAQIGEPFDDSQPVEPMTMYQIEGTGALIAELGS